MNSLSISFDSVRNSITDYLNQVPKDTTVRIAWIGGAAFLIGVLIGDSPAFALHRASICAVATAIHGLVTPLFRRFADRRSGQLSYPLEMVRTSVAVLGGVGFSLAAGFGWTSTPLAISLIINGLWNFKKENRSIHSTNCTVA